MDEEVEQDIHLHLTLDILNGTIEVSSNSQDPFELLDILSNAARIVMEQYGIEDSDFEEERILH